MSKPIFRDVTIQQIYNRTWNRYYGDDHFAVHLPSESEYLYVITHYCDEHYRHYAESFKSDAKENLFRDVKNHLAVRVENDGKYKEKSALYWMLETVEDISDLDVDDIKQRVCDYLDGEKMTRKHGQALYDAFCNCVVRRCQSYALGLRMI